MLLSRQPNIANKNCCYNCLESYDSAYDHGDSYVNLLSRDGLKHPSKQLIDCVARGFAILDALSATILKSILPSKKKADKIILTSYLDSENLFEKARMFD